jgi:eukaryotic-like serine/threonine-protein kinase
MQAREAECCPRCGATVLGVGVSKLTKTLFLREAPTAAAQAGCVDNIDEPADELVGTQLHVYRCEALLGRGAMGRVYLAYHEDLGRNCALKVLSPRVWQTDIEYGKRFISEGRTAAALVHPNIVTTHAIGEARGYRFLEMEFVPGRSLQELIEHEQRLLPAHAMSLILRIAEGLAAAHQKGIIHRDLKPDNVLVSVQSVPKIADFGLAKRVWSERDDAELLVGTPHYMAPELFNGEPATAASDVYALGTCLFVMLTGQVPYQCASIQALAERVQQDESPPDFRQLGVEVPLEIADCLDLLMAKTPANRPKDASEALQLLMAVGGDLPDVASLLGTALGSQPNVSWTHCGEKFCIEVRLPEGRRQTVFIEPSAHPVADRLLLIYSQCGDARPEYFERGLRLNAQMAHGGLAIRDIAGMPQFVMIDTYPRATVDAEEIRRSVLELASQADAVERLLSGVDRY